jgi:hypothetical protein
MEETQEFTGLSMPVFTAFGWAGEETALNFALSQLELFIHELHKALPHSVKEKLPAAGLNHQSQAVYLAEAEGDEAGAFIAFLARPMSLEIQLAIQDKKALAKGLKLAEKQPAICHRLITELGPDWSLRVQQMQVDEESGEAANYQELFKDSITAFDEETAVALFSKAAYLNDDDQWVTPFFLSRRFPSEQISVMGTTVLSIMLEHIDNLMPVFDFLTGQTKKKAKAKPRTKVVPKVEDTQITETQLVIEPDEGFVYVAELKPLHIRRGFINLTSEHWPFFAINSRTETRPVTIYYNGIYDKGSSVWRLVPNDQARVVLSTAVHGWLEDTFDANDKIQVTARMMDEDEIQISLKLV